MASESNIYSWLKRDGRSLSSWVRSGACVVVIALLIGAISGKILGFGLVPAVVMGLTVFGVGMFAIVHLRDSPRELGLTFGLKLLSVMAYKLLNVTLVLWLARDLGFSSEKALALISGWSLLMTITTLLSGSIADALGLRRTLFIGVSICLICRLLMLVSCDPWVALGGGLLPLALGEALCTPVLVAALRRYSTPAQRSVAFSLFYALMNFGFMVANFLFDGVRELVPAGQGLSLPGLGQLSQYRVMLLVSLVVELGMIPMLLLLRERSGCGESPSHDSVPSSLVSGEPIRGVWQAVRTAAADTIGLLRGLVGHEGFHRLLLFLLLIGLLKVVFNVMDFVLPPFILRELGPEARIGRFNAINGMLILVLAPVVGMLTRKYSAYSMVVVGGLLTAGSFGFMVIPTHWVQPFADGWLGSVIGSGYMELQGAVHPYYLMIVFWQVMFSVGEAFYSPRVYEYAASIAPKGQEASYASLSYVPLLIGKLITGTAFGGLLERYCPAEGERNPAMMWGWIGAMVLAAPLGLWGFRRWIRVPEEGRSDG